MRFFPRAVLVLAAGSLLAEFGACAKGSAIGEGGGGAGGESSVGAGGMMMLPVGQVGGPCDENGKCEKGMCTQLGKAKYCTQPCPPACPKGTYCSLILGDPTCIPDLGQECDRCNDQTDCKMPSDRCLVAPLGDKFCARDCSTLGECPTGFTCVESEGYPPTPIMDAGGGSGGAGGLGGAGGASASTSSSSGAGGTAPGLPHKFCVPDADASCPCSPKRDGVIHQCVQQSSFGRCTGRETCDGKKAAFEGCDAKMPAVESCNGLDDNCDGAIDEGDPNMLCMAMGTPDHSKWVCSMAKCTLGPCDKGWTDYPPGKPTIGCSCPMEKQEPNNTCGTAADMGTVDDIGANIALKGTLSSDTDVDVFTFQTTDTPEANTNSYHVQIAFVAPMPNDEFQMDVMRGNPCADVPSGPAANITSYDWGVNGNSPNVAGEAPCGPNAGQSHCADHSARYYVRVHRKSGAKPSCAPYEISVTGHAAAAPDFTKQCP